MFVINMASESSTISDSNFCPECGNILPIPGVDETVSCLDCGFKVNARDVDVKTYKIKFHNKGKYRKKEECKDVANAGPLIQQDITQEYEAVKEIQNVPFEFSTELRIDCAISSCPSYDISIPTDISPPAAPSNPDLRPAPTPVGHKRGSPISPVRAVKRSKPAESTSACSGPSTSQSNAGGYKKTTDSKSRKHAAIKEEKKDGKKFGGSSSDINLVEMMGKHILQKNQSIRWDDIADLREAKKLLEEAVVLPMGMPDFLNGIQRPWKSVLMVSSRGTGTTTLAKAVATECKATFFSVSFSSISCIYGDKSEKLIRLLFEMARFFAPSLIFIDEIDSLCSQREYDPEPEINRRVKSEFLIQMEENNHDPRNRVFVIAASNFPWDIDQDLHNRFQKCIYIPLPNASEREALLKRNSRKFKVCPDVDLKQVANSLEGYSEAEILDICGDALLMHMRRRTAGLTYEEVCNIPKQELGQPVSADDFREAIEKNKKSVSKEDLEKYDKWMAEFGSR